MSRPFVGTLTRWFSGSLSGKTVTLCGDSTSPPTASEIATWLAANATIPGACLGGVNVLQWGQNGQTLDAFINNNAGITFGTNAVISQAPDLCVICYGINDVRDGSTNQATLISKLQSAVTQIQTGSPNTDILLWGSNCFLTTDVNGNGFVTPNSSAQAYSTVLYNAYAAMIGFAPHMAVIQKQDWPAFGKVCLALSQYMTDQLHPNFLGQDQEGMQLISAIGKFP